MNKPTKKELLEYAKEGLRMLIGSHPDPLHYPEELQEYEEHLAWVNKQLKVQQDVK